jgi:hypothetical protein
VGGWLVLVAVLGGLDVFRARDVGIPFIAPGLAVPIIAGVVLLRRSETLRRLVAATPPAGLVALHTLRVLGAIFLVLMAGGKLPGVFAYTAGVGDILIAVAAPFVAWALATGRSWSRQAAVAFNVAGLADFVGAVGTGFFSAPSPIRLLFTTPSTELMTVLPMILVPVFLVPAFTLLHVFSLWQLRGRTTTTDVAPVLGDTRGVRLSAGPVR